jgi:hypothetical protein
MSWRIPYAAMLGLAVLATPLPAYAGKAPVVVELFTSQGCSSCPPANANLIKLSHRPDILALSFSVTYWDYLGWKDTFDDPKYTNRQAAYEKPLGQDGPYTPQMVINGRTTVVGNDLSEISRAIAAVKPLAGPGIVLEAHKVFIDAGKPSGSGADVWLVQYDPNLVEVPVRRGENIGHTLPHINVVHSLVHLGTWTGKRRFFTIPTAKHGYKTAVLVQAFGGGPILAAATL